MQPALVGEGDTEDLTPEAVGGDHGIGLFFLSGLERLEGVGLLTVLKQGVFHGGAVNGAEECTAEDAGDAHHVEGVQGPVMEALEEEKEAEDRCHTVENTTPVQVAAKSSTTLYAQVNQRFRNEG